MAYSEFPNWDSASLDYHELIGLYKETRDKYAGTLREIEALENRLDAYEKNVDSRINGAVQSALNTYKQSVQLDIDQRFSAIEQTITNRLAEQDRKIADFITDTNDNISEFTRRLSNRVEEFERSVTTQLTENQHALMEFLEDMENSYVYRQDTFEEYVTGQIQYIRNTLPTEIESIKWLWNKAIKLGGFSAKEWYQFPWCNCREWNTTDITCAEWFADGRRKLKHDEELSKMLSPVTGERMTVQEAVAELAASMATNAIKAGDYDALGLTAEEFNAFYMSPAEYDWAGIIAFVRQSNEEERWC